MENLAYDGTKPDLLRFQAATPDFERLESEHESLVAAGIDAPFRLPLRLHH